jgi:N-dimethylarginine dimethylaminohydrolase
MVEIKEYQNKCANIEIDYKKLQDQWNIYSGKYESNSMEIQRLQEQEKMNKLKIEELNTCKNTST